MAHARPGRLCLLAIGYGQQPAFREFFHVGDEEAAKALILRTCHIASRKELDTNPTAADIFHAKFRRPFAYRAGA